MTSRRRWLLLWILDTIRRPHRPTGWSRPCRPPPRRPSSCTRSTPCSTTRSARSATPCASSSTTASCPTSADWFEEGTFPAASWPRSWARSALLGMHLEGYGCAGTQRRRLRPGLPRARGRRLRAPQLRLRAGLAGHVPDLEVRVRGAEAGVAAPDGRRRGDRLLRPDRARLRLDPASMRTRPGATVTTGSSTAPRCGSPTAASPTSPSCGRADGDDGTGIRGFVVPTDTPGFAATRHPPASCRCGPRSPPSSCSTTCACPTRRRAARGARAAWPALVPQRGPLRHPLGRRSARPAPASRPRSTTPRAASSSTSPIAGFQLTQAQARRDDGAGSSKAHAAGAAPRRG